MVKVHGKELALGLVTGIITKLIADKTKEPKKSKKEKAVTEEEQPAIATTIKETTKAVANKVKAAIVPAKTNRVRKAPVRKPTPEPAPQTETITEAV